MTHAGAVSHNLAEAHAHTEFEKYEVERRRLEAERPASDFDRVGQGGEAVGGRGEAAQVGWEEAREEEDGGSAEVDEGRGMSATHGQPRPARPDVAIVASLEEAGYGE